MPDPLFDLVSLRMESVCEVNFTTAKLKHGCHNLTLALTLHLLRRVEATHLYQETTPNEAIRNIPAWI